MAELTKNDIAFIKTTPELQIERERSSLQEALDSTATDSQRTDVFPPDNGHESDTTEPDEGPSKCAGSSDCSNHLTCGDLKDAISGLLVALLGHRVAKKLRSKGSGGTVVGELAQLLNRLDSGRIEITFFDPLVQAVVQKASDLQIWKQVLQLIASSSRLTPPPSVSASFGGTPRTHTSASHQGSEQTKRLLHDPIRDELHNCSHIKVKGFFEKYFDNKSWTPKSKDIFGAMKSAHSDSQWTTFPDRSVESAVWEWWSQFQADHLTDLPGLYHRAVSKAEMANTEGERQLDLFVKSRHV